MNSRLYRRFLQFDRITQTHFDPSTGSLTHTSPGHKGTKISTGLSIEFLGTASSCPSFKRNVSSLLIHHATQSVMIDCGDGTSRQLAVNGTRLSRINAMLITHLHGDHFYGVPAVGKLLALAKNKKRLDTVISNRIADFAGDRTLLYGPSGLGYALGPGIGHNLTQPIRNRDESLSSAATHHFELIELLTGKSSPISSSSRIINLSSDGFFKNIYEDAHVTIDGGFIKHTIPTIGYVITEKPMKHRLDVSLLQDKYKLLPGPLYGQLQQGMSIVYNGHSIDPDNVFLPVSTPRKIVVLGDTCNALALLPLAMDADVVIHEATCPDKDQEHALEGGHSTPTMAGLFAKECKAKALILTHIGPRHERLSDSLINAQRAFENPNVFIAKDFWVFHVPKRNEDDLSRKKENLAIRLGLK